MAKDQAETGLKPSPKAVRKGRKTIAKTAVALQRLAVEYVPHDSIHPNTYNPNRQSEHEFELLRRSMLAAGEFGQAWVPGANTEGDQAGARTGMTSAALEQMREQERKLAAAKTEQERQAVKRDLDVYRISLVFANEEAKVVRDVLGDKPADALLQLCKAARR